MRWRKILVLCTAATVGLATGGLIYVLRQPSMADNESIGESGGTAVGDQDSTVEVEVQLTTPPPGEPWEQFLPGLLPTDDRPPASGDCDSLYTWARERGATDIRTYVRVEIRAQEALDLTINTVNAKVLDRRPTDRDVVLYCTPHEWNLEGGFAPSGVTEFKLDNDEPARAPDRVGGPPEPRHLQMRPGDRHELLFEASSFHGTIIWELELDVMVDEQPQRLVLRNGTEPFSTPEFPHGAGYTPPGYEWCWQPQPHLAPLAQQKDNCQ